MAKLKVYSGRMHVCGNRSACVCVATTSQKKVAEITNSSVNYVRDYWGVTGNKNQIEAAMDNPETLIAEYPDYSGNFMSLEEVSTLIKEEYEKALEEKRKRIEEKKKD